MGFHEEMGTELLIWITNFTREPTISSSSIPRFLSQAILCRGITPVHRLTIKKILRRSEEELKSLLMKVKEESGKAGLKLSIKKTKIMTSGPITSWQIDGEKMKTVTDFIFLGSKITADGDCSHEIKRCLLLGRKAMTNLDSVLKSRDITLPTKVYIVKAMIFPVVTYGCQSWTIKKAER